MPRTELSGVRLCRLSFRASNPGGRREVLVLAFPGGVTCKGHPMYSFLMVLGYLLFFLLLLPASSPAVPHPPATSFGTIAKQADTARDSNHVAEAINLYSQGVRLRPQWSEGWWSLGSLLYDQDRFAEAEVALKHFAAQTAKPGVAYPFLGLCEYETKEYDHALAHFRAWARAGWPGTP